MGVATGDDQGENRRFGRLLPPRVFQQNGMDVTFEMIHGDERLAQREGQRFGIGDADQQRAGESGAAGDGDCVNILEANVSLSKRSAHHGDDIPQVLARGEFGDDSAEERMSGNLRGHDIGEGLATAANHRCRRFVAGAFDSQNEAGARARVDFGGISRSRLRSGIHIFNIRGAGVAAWPG